MLVPSAYPSQGPHFHLSNWCKVQFFPFGGNSEQRSNHRQSSFQVLETSPTFPAVNDHVAFLSDHVATWTGLVILLFLFCAIV